ncbi:asparagine synthetase B [Sphaerisporangium rufum]|uniref:asparagine synthase (glutamine-hydrolyzing) n=1 Tax=Sphaerisporangium rufum TaxID=1381558 RepID=A0A919V295_9ACTN|nr:asparagine synthase (glutamine-hydrolyzing) [Sphaerisporangium rufum]GII78703.1 asparagine synthetase B [Sphaerisporangium rufum]
MCGIAGIVGAGPPDPELVRRMCAVIRHRGPDGEGFHTDGRAALGMRRLAVLDLVAGDQPVYSEDGQVVAVFNGELYNFAELRADLARRGHRLRGTGDSECLVHLYEEHGPDLVHRLRGMFAFAVWDRGRGRLLLARDRVGKKPLYWRAGGGSIAFASELKSLACDPELRREIDPVALHHYLTLQYVPAPLSIYRGVRKLPPGHLLVWQDGAVSVRRYWELDRTPRPPGDPREAAARLRELLLESTRIRLVSDRPVGAFLSGGIDSSAVVAAMARQVSGPVRTFCIGFEDGRYDERHKARLVARRYGTDHHELVVTTDLLDVVPRLAWHFDEPFADSSAIPSFYVARLGREHVTVVLNGDGGDESFGGYQRYVLMGKAGLLPALPGPLAALAGRAGDAITARGERTSRSRRIGRLAQFAAEPPPRRYARLMAAFTQAQKMELYTGPLRAALAGVDSYRLLEDAAHRSGARTALDRTLSVDLATYLPGDLLVKVDITSMANSLEARSPFLDHRLMEWAAALPPRWKIRGGTTKALLRHALAPWLPAEVLRLPKQGFGVPLADWLRGPLREPAFDLLTDATARERGLFRPEVVRGMLHAHAAGADHAVRLWTLLQFELWHRAHAGRPAPGDVPPGFPAPPDPGAGTPCTSAK